MQNGGQLLWARSTMVAKDAPFRNCFRCCSGSNSNSSIKKNTTKGQRKGTRKRDKSDDDDDGYKWMVAVNNQHSSKRSLSCGNSRFDSILFQTTRLIETTIFCAHEKQTFQLGRVAVYLFQPKTKVLSNSVFLHTKQMFPKQTFSQKQTKKLVENEKK